MKVVVTKILKTQIQPEERISIHNVVAFSKGYIPNVTRAIKEILGLKFEFDRKAGDQNQLNNDVNERREYKFYSLSPVVVVETIVNELEALELSLHN